MDRRTQLVVSSNYFAYFLWMGSFWPFVTLFLQNSGWSGLEIGIYTAIGPIVAFLTQPLWGLLSDSWGNSKLLYGLLLCAASAVIFAFGLLPPTSVFFLMAFFLGVLHGPLNPLLDGLVLANIGQNQSRLGQMRLWGSLSFAIIVYLIGQLYATNNRIIFFINTIFALAAIFAVSYLPNTRVNSKARLSLDIAALRKVWNPPFYSFLLAVFLVQVAQNTSMSFLALLLSDRGATSSMYGNAWSLTAALEIPVFLLSAKFLAKGKPEQLLLVGAVITSVRITLLALVYSPQLLVLIHAIDGFAFPLLLVSLTLIVYRLVPDEYKTTGLTVYFAFAQTLPRLLGGLVGGRVYDVWGGTTLYLSAAVTAFIGCGSIALWQRGHSGSSEPRGMLRNGG